MTAVVTQDKTPKLFQGEEFLVPVAGRTADRQLQLLAHLEIASAAGIFLGQGHALFGDVHNQWRTTLMGHGCSGAPPWCQRGPASLAWFLTKSSSFPSSTEVESDDSINVLPTNHSLLPNTPPSEGLLRCHFLKGSCVLVFQGCQSKYPQALQQYILSFSGD